MFSESIEKQHRAVMGQTPFFALNVFWGKKTNLYFYTHALKTLESSQSDFPLLLKKCTLKYPIRNRLT